MSIQDKIFDVENKLHDEPEAKDFEDIVTYLSDLEREIEVYKAFYQSAVELSIAVDKVRKKQKGG